MKTNCCSIDTHAHLWSDNYLDKLASAGSPDTEIAKNIGAGISKSDLEKRIAMMDKAGVQYQVLSVTPQSPQWGTKEEALALAQEINNLYAEIINQYPDRFIAYGAVPLPYVEESILESRRVIQELGFNGIAVNTLIQNKITIADKKFRPFFEEINQLNTILYIHPTGCGANSQQINEYGLEWVIGAPVEDIIAPLQLLKQNYHELFPNITFHIAHLGGGLPFLMQRIEDNFEDWNAFSSSPTEAFKSRFWFDTANFHEPALILSNETLGNSQLLLGSDFPYFQNEKYTRAVTYIKNSRLSKIEIENILSNNAKKLYQLPK